MLRKINILFLLVFAACSNSALSPVDYIKWMENKDNGMWVSKQINIFEYSVMYKTPDYVALREMNRDSISEVLLEKKKEELKGLQYFTLKIKANEGNDLLKAGIGSEQEYYDRLNYFSGFMGDDIKLIDGKDTLSCKLFLMERNYGLAPYNNFVLGFPATKNENDKQVEINDKVLGVGKIILKISKEDIENIPQLKI